jgi:pteridine reductase
VPYVRLSPKATIIASLGSFARVGCFLQPLTNSGTNSINNIAFKWKVIAMSVKRILITGAAKRIGAACARLLHAEGHVLLLHYRSSADAAEALCAELNRNRPGSAISWQADLQLMDELQTLAAVAEGHWGGIDVLVNNASAFYPTPFEDTDEAQWSELLNSNMKAPFFLIQALASSLAANHGCVVNIVDIYGERGLPGYPVYSIAKAGLAAMTRILAKELAPAIRVNGVAPGAILWPEGGSGGAKTAILSRIPLQRRGDPEDVAKAVRFLIQEAGYVTGQILNVDGGRTLFC